jgi:hypothetical protein
MQFTLTIETDNAAFAGGRRALRLELERITAKAAARIEDGETSGKCMDTNGNSVGSWVLQ